jgi:hypothetical protein
MAMFNSYVKLPEGSWIMVKLLGFNREKMVISWNMNRGFMVFFSNYWMKLEYISRLDHIGRMGIINPCSFGIYPLC